MAPPSGFGSVGTTVAIGGGLAGTASGSTPDSLAAYNVQARGIPHDLNISCVAWLTNFIFVFPIGVGGQATLYFGPGDYYFDANFTFPANIRIWMAKGARFNALAAGLTLTINGDLDAPLDQIFSNANALSVVMGTRHDVVRPEWWGALADGGVTDSTIALQATIKAARVTQATIRGSGVYLATDTLTIYTGSVFDGGPASQISGGNQNGIAMKILFRPTSLKDAIQCAEFHAGGADGHIYQISLSALHIVCDNGNGRYGFNLSNVIYSQFNRLIAQGFQNGYYCKQTIQNRFEFCSANTNSVSSVWYDGGNCTSDVWEQPSMFTSPIGFQLAGAIGIRINNPVLEQITEAGIDIARDCENILVGFDYTEDVPYAGATVNSAMFRVGYSGAGGANVQNQLTVVGGKFQGRSAGAGGVIGYFLDCDFCTGVMLVACNWTQFPQIIRTTGNTRVNAIQVLGGNGNGWGATFANDVTKLCGVYPDNPLTTAASSLTARLASLAVTGIATVSALVATGAIYLPVVANVDLPAPGAGNNGRIYLDSTNHRIVYYENNLRYFMPIGTSF